ncbi:MAG: HAD-IC family P-type ATPase [Comamonadaceae bacterium]|nr:HAD-IC family P-type ATPase [Comamonadaceae bacterium]
MLWDKTGTLTHGPGPRRGRAHRCGDVTEPAGARAGPLRSSSCPSTRSPGRSPRPAQPTVRASDGRGARRAAASRAASTAGGCGSARAPSPRLVAAGRAPATADAAADAASGESWVYLGDEHGLLAAFRLTDPLRAEAASCVAGARGARACASEIVSGDEAARRGAHCGALRHRAHVGAPRRRRTSSRASRRCRATGAVVVAVGDGINDAPLLRGADVAVAMGRGSALAQTSADLILVRESLDDLPHTVALARRTQRIIRQNLGWSIAYNLAALPLAALGFVPPWLAAIGMSLSSVVVVLNAMRLSRGSTPAAAPGLAGEPAGGGRLTWKSSTS